MYVDSGALISADQLYRYWLWRHWGAGSRRVLFIMLNPSTADGLVDDPTIRRCVAFARLWGFDGCEIVNAYAYRATNPAALRAVADPVGPANELIVKFRIERAGLIIAAWGNHGAARQAIMKEWLTGREVWALRLSRDRQCRQ